MSNINIGYNHMKNHLPKRFFGYQKLERVVFVENWSFSRVLLSLHMHYRDKEKDVERLMGRSRFP